MRIPLLLLSKNVIKISESCSKASGESTGKQTDTNLRKAHGLLGDIGEHSVHMAVVVGLEQNNEQHGLQLDEADRRGEHLQEDLVPEG